MDVRPATSGRPVRVEIGTLVLDGLPALDAGLVAAAVERELARLLAAEPPGPGLTRPRAIGSLPGGPVELAPGDGPEGVGAKIGRALHAALRPPTGPGVGHGD
jgi:hypothetical protein